MRVTAVALGCAGAVAVLAGCGSKTPYVPGTLAAGSTEPATPSAAVTTTYIPAPTVAPSASGGTEKPGVMSFQSPSGDITCQIDTGSATCVEREAHYTPPPRPTSCHLGWGPTLTVSGNGKGRILCADNPIDPKRTLAYGSTISVGDLRCVSKRTGMTCESDVTHHGFFVAREKYRLF